jgi:hypothetical protein
LISGLGNPHTLVLFYGVQESDEALVQNAGGKTLPAYIGDDGKPLEVILWEESTARSCVKRELRLSAAYRGKLIKKSITLAAHRLTGQKNTAHLLLDTLNEDRINPRELTKT